MEKSTRTMERENALGKGGGKRRRGVGLALGKRPLLRRCRGESAACPVLDVLDDLVDGRVKDGVRGEAALDHGDV